MQCKEYASGLKCNLHVDPEGAGIPKWDRSAYIVLIQVIFILFFFLSNVVAVSWCLGIIPCDTRESC